jgi:signal transduction histidine kinase
VAEVELISDDKNVTVMVTDRGQGFDPAAVGSDRLGLRSSVAERMAAVGGSARVWSAPGEGTSVIISAPISQEVGS